MKKLVSLFFILLPLLLCLGCAGVTSVNQPLGVSQGTLAGDVTYPTKAMTQQTRFEFDTKDFEVLKSITVETTSRNVLGLFSNGDNGYGKLYKKARKVGADDVINIKTDTNVTSYLTFFYVEATTKVTGTAIEWTNN